MMLFGDNGLSVWRVLADAETSGEYLKEAWNRTAASQNLEFFEPEGLNATFRKGEEGRDLVVITMPEPIAPC